jgi:hypothetical protein
MTTDTRRPLTPRTLLRLLVAGVLASTLFAIGAPAASAARPCWKDLVDDYWADNRVDKVYPISCYRDAMEALPRDVKEYSDAQDDLRRALLIAIRNERDRGGDSEFRSAAGPTGPDVPPPAAADDGVGGKGGFLTEVIHKLGPKNASSVPVPLLVLAAIALLLVGAAGVSYATRWYQARRVTVGPPEAHP